MKTAQKKEHHKIQPTLDDRSQFASKTCCTGNVFSASALFYTC